MRRSLVAVGAILLIGSTCTILISSADRRRGLLSNEYKLPASASLWCSSTSFNNETSSTTTSAQLAPLNYHHCNASDTVYRVPFIGGLTNGLKMMLLSVIRAYEENRCFYVEEHSDLISRDKSAKQFDSFVERYFDPIGLPSDDPIIVQAKDEGRLATLEWKDVWFQHRKQHGNQHTIDNLGYENMDGHILKRIMLQRMWRLNPKVKAKTCQQLEQTLGHEEYDFLAFSIRRGDKINENFKLTPLGEYIREAERVIAQHFIGMQAPKIFVATDDCRVMNKLRSLKPNWTFVSMCDDSNGNENGFRLADMRVWTQEETDRHFFKFFVELYALTISKYYIGVGYTNVAWWTFFMRTHARWTTTLLDHPADFGALVNNW